MRATTSIRPGAHRFIGGRILAERSADRSPFRAFTTRRTRQDFFFFSEEVPPGEDSHGLQPGGAFAERARSGDDGARHSAKT